MLFKWNQTDDISCICGYPEETTNHILTKCPVFTYEGKIDGIKNLSGLSLNWLKGSIYDKNCISDMIFDLKFF